MNAPELIEAIYNLCQNTPNHNITPNNSYEYAEAQRLDEVLTEISDMCDEFLSFGTSSELGYKTKGL